MIYVSVSAPNSDCAVMKIENVERLSPRQTSAMPFWRLTESVKPDRCVEILWVSWYVIRARAVVWTPAVLKWVPR